MKLRCRPVARSCAAQSQQAHSDLQGKTVRQLREDEASQFQNAHQVGILKLKKSWRTNGNNNGSISFASRERDLACYLRETPRSQRLCVIFFWLFSFDLQLSTVNFF